MLPPVFEEKGAVFGMKIHTLEGAEVGGRRREKWRVKREKKMLKERNSFETIIIVTIFAPSN